MTSSLIQTLRGTLENALEDPPYPMSQLVKKGSPFSSVPEGDVGMLYNLNWMAVPQSQKELGAFRWNAPGAEDRAEETWTSRALQLKQ